MSRIIPVLVFLGFAFGWAGIAYALQVHPAVSFMVGMLIGVVAFFAALAVHDRLADRRLK